MGRVALQLAVEGGHCDVTELLINRGTDTSELTKVLLSKWFKSSDNLALHYVWLFLNVLIFILFQTGQSLLMVAATLGHTDIVALLVKEERADVDKVNPVSLESIL